MIRISDNSLIDYFSSMQTGHELSRDEVSKHLALYSFDFEGVTGQEDLQKFRVTSPGEITEKAGLVQSRIKLSPVFADPGLENRQQLASEFNESIATQAYHRSKTAIEMEMYRQKGVNFKTDTKSFYQMSFNIYSNGDVGMPEDFRPSFSLKKGGDNVRLTLPEATREALEGTDLFNEIYSEVLMGSKQGLRYDKNNRTFVQTKHVEESELTVAPKGKYIPRKDDVTLNETNFSEKLDKMLKQVSSMDRELEDFESIINTLHFEDASRIESLNEKQILKEYEGINEMIQSMSIPSTQDEINIKTEVDKRLGVDAKQDAKDRLTKELMDKKQKELELEHTKAFKDNVKMYVADRRDYLSSDNRTVGVEEQLDDMYKEAYAFKKAEEDKDRHINRLRAATHTQQEDGSWVKNDRLPNRVADKTRQAIAIDMNPASAPDPLSASLIGTVQRGEQNLIDAQNNIEAEMESLKEKRKALSRAYDEQPKSSNGRKSSHIIELEADIERQKATVSRLQNLIQSDGYEKEFGKTIFNKEDGWLEQVGISKEMYDEYRANPEKLKHDIDSVTAESAFNRERSKVANRESWYRALGTEQIVKGHYNDERGYRVTEINPDTNIAYLARPSMRVSQLQYSADIENKELLQNISLAEEALMTRYNPSNAVVSDYDVSISNFEDISKGHITVVAEIPAIEYVEPEVSEADMKRARQSIETYIQKGGNVRYETLPKQSTFQLDQYIQEHEMQRMSILDDIEIAKKSLAKAKKTGVSTEELKFEQDRLKAEQDRLTAFSKQQNALRNSITEQILGEIKESRINEIVKRNDRVAREIELFGFKQGVDNSRVELSAESLTRIVIGGEKGTSAFYRKMIDGHLPHLKNEKGNGTGSVAAAALEVIADHVSQRTEFDLTDEAVARKYMQRLNSDALTPADLSDEQQSKLNKYIKSLPGMGHNERLRDSLFTEILHKTMEIEYGGKDGEFSGMGNTVKSIYDEMRIHYPEADITGQSIHSYIHNKENGVYGDLKRTYQSKVLSLSPNMLDSVLSQYRTMGDVSLDALAENGREAADRAEEAVNEYVDKSSSKMLADEKLAAYEEAFPSDDVGARKLMAIDESQYERTSAFSKYLDKEIDMSDLKNMDLSDKNWSKLIDQYPHMEKVQELIKRSSIKIRQSRDPEGIHAGRAARLSVYALGALNNREAKYQTALRLEDSIDIFDGTNLMNKALSNPGALSERQLSTTLELAESLGKKVNVRIPIGDGEFSDGFLRFNEANEVEAYSPALKQAYLVNDTGTSKISTVRMDDMRAYGTDNRIKAAKSYSKQQPILKQSIANEAQMKRSGNSLLISNVDSSFGELVDFVEKNKVGISYDIETTMTNPNKLKSVVQPIEIYAQQIQMNPETGDLYRDDQGNFAVRENTMEEVIDENGNTQHVKGNRIVAKDYHAIMALEQPALDLINKIAADENYFDIGQAQGNRVHIVDFINRSSSKTGSDVDFIHGLLGKKLRKNKASALMNELTTKAEEYQFLNNVAKYSFGANKNEMELERFGVYSNAKAVDTSEGYAAHLKNNDRTLYNDFFHSDGTFNTSNTNYFKRLTYEHQAEQTKALVSDALRAASNLENPDFNFGEGIRRVSVAEGISGFADFQKESGSDVFFVQNGEIADNKTLVDSAKLIDSRSNKNTKVFDEGLNKEIQKITAARDKLFHSEIGKFTEEFAEKFDINPLMAQEHRLKEAEVLADPNRDMVGYLKSKKKVWVSSLTEALEYIPELNRTTSNVRFTSNELKEVDKQLDTYTSMVNKLKLKGKLGEFTAEELKIGKDLDLFDGNPFSMKKNTVYIPKLEKKVQAMYDNAGVSDQQNISRVVNPELRSQSNASLMEALKTNSDLAHEGRFDTIFGSQNVERFTKQVFNHINNVEGTETPLGYILRSMDNGSLEDGGFMERNAYRGDGTEHIAFTERPDDGIQKGVYRLLGFNESGTEATLQRVIQGSEGIIDDTSVEPVKLPGQTNAELAHKFAQSVRYVPEENVSTEISNYNRDISRRHFDKILANNLSYESHMNQLREMEIESGAYNQFKTNPLFAIDDSSKPLNLLNASMEDLIEATGNNGAINLQSNPLQRAREMFAKSVTPKEELRKIIDNDETVALSDVDRSLIRNSHLLDDQSKEKFYNKKMTKEQVLALQEINDFNHTDLGVRLSDLMDNVTALESQGHVSKAEKADILSGWNEALKQKAEASNSTYKIQNTAVLPSFMLNIKDETGEIKGVPIQSNIQVSSPTEVANSLKNIANQIGGLKEYSTAKGMVGLKEDYALNAEVVPHLKNLGVLNASDIEIGPDKNRFMGLGELSHMVYNNLQENPDLLERSTAIDYLKLAKNMSDEDLDFMDTKSEELLGKYFARQTDVQALQFEGLIESKQMLRNEGLYIPGMKLETGKYSLEDIEDLKQYSTSSFLGQRSTSELVGMADRMAGSGSSADKERTKLIYREIMNRAATGDDGKKNIDPKAIIDSGSHRRIEAAAAMNWIQPITRDANMYVPNKNIAEHRIGYGQFAGAKLGDIPEGALDNQSYMAYKNMSLPNYEQRYNRMPHMQQQELIANWSDKGYDGHDHDAGNKFYTARGERPLSAEDLAAQNNQIKEEFGNKRRNETPGSLSTGNTNSVEELVSRAREENPTQFFANNEKIASQLNIHPAVSEEDVQVKSAERAEIEKPRGHHSSPISDYITNQRANLKDEFGSLLEGGNGAKWVAGLGVAAAALYAVNAINSPMKLETRPAGHGVQGVTGTPEDDTDRPNRQAEGRESLNAPNVQTGGTSYVTSGEKGYTIKASGKAPSNIDSSQLQSTINNSMSGTNGVNINLRDDRSTLDGSWLENQFSNFIERGSVGG